MLISCYIKFGCLFIAKNMVFMPYYFIHPDTRLVGIQLVSYVLYIYESRFIPLWHTIDYLLMRAGFIPFKKKVRDYFSSMQNRVTTMQSIFCEISLRNANIGSQEPLTPFTRRCARYLLLSRKRLSVCCGDSLKFLEMEMTKNYRILAASLNCFLDTYRMSTCNGFDAQTVGCYYY